MASATGRVDELVKDYLIYRGLTTTYRTFEAELKNDKEKGLRVSFLFILHGMLLPYLTSGALYLYPARLFTQIYSNTPKYTKIKV